MKELWLKFIHWWHHRKYDKLGCYPCQYKEEYGDLPNSNRLKTYHKNGQICFVCFLGYKQEEGK